MGNVRNYVKIISDTVNGKLIATGKGGNEVDMPWATVVFDIDTDVLIDVKWYSTKEEAIKGHEGVKLNALRDTRH